MTTSDIDFLHGSHVPLCNARVDKHFEGYYTLQFMEEGLLKLSYDDKQYDLEGPWFWPAYPGPHIRFHAAKASWNHRHIAFMGPLAHRWLADGLFPSIPQPAPDKEASIQLFDALLSEFRSPGRWHQRKAVNSLERILIELAEARHERRTSEPWLDNVLKVLNDQPEFFVDYNDTAEAQGMSLSSLRRKFRHAMGVPIHRYALQLRMASARRRLEESDIPLKTIAEELGYANVYFFSRQFKKETGMTPGAFRKSCQE